MMIDTMVPVENYASWEMDNVITFYHELKPVASDAFRFQQDLDTDGSATVESSIVNGPVILSIDSNGLTIKSKEEEKEKVREISERCFN
jgi:hypothetical protein